MKISDPDADLLCDELEMIVAELPLDDALVLELGCGNAEKTRAIAQWESCIYPGTGSGCHPACPEPADNGSPECHILPVNG